MTFDDDPDKVPPPPSIAQCFVFFDGGRLRANDNGRKRFGDRFRRAGFDIDRIRTFDDLEAALRGSWHIVIGDLERAFEQRAAGKDSLDHRVARASYRGDDDEAQRLRERRRRIAEMGLRVVDDAPDDA
jgi:hypothetical protein